MRRFLPSMLLVIVLGSGCHSPTFPELDDSFDGVLQPQGVDWHQFVIEHPGDLNVTVTKFDPLTTASFGVGIGVIDGTDCVVTSAATGHLNQSGLLSVSTGTYCIQLSDTGEVTEPVSYTVKLRHF